MSQSGRLGNGFAGKQATLSLATIFTRKTSMPPGVPQEPHDDADLIRWFQALGPPPPGQAPPHLRASVRARIEQYRVRRGLWAWLRQPWPGGLVPALATGFVLSLAVNIWWGLERPDTKALTEQKPAYTYQFLQTIHGASTPGSLVASRPAVSARPTGLGFALQETRVIYFRQGWLFADALAALHSGASQVAVQRLDTLTKSLQSLQAPQALYRYLEEMRALQQQQRYTDPELASFLALFETLYESEYSQDQDPTAVPLFRLGAWLETLALAAAAGDAAALRQAPAVDYFRQALITLDAPPELLQAFADLQRLASSPAMSAVELRTFRQLVQQAQQTLGALDL
jgi:hypothetical protein